MSRADMDFRAWDRGGAGSEPAGSSAWGSGPGRGRVNDGPMMAPGSDPYTSAELAVLGELVRDAADGDPGELAEDGSDPDAPCLCGDRPGTRCGGKWGCEL